MFFNNIDYDCSNGSGGRGVELRYKEKTDFKFVGIVCNTFLLGVLIMHT